MKMKIRSIITVNIALLILSLLITSVVAEPSAIRDIQSQCVEPDNQVTVTITVSDYGAIGEVKETFCEGWTYIETSLKPSQVTVDDNTVKFYLFGESSFTYNIRVPNSPDECCTISGTIKDQHLNSFPVTGQSEICICPVGWCDIYDTNGISGIQKDEAIKAINDYLLYSKINKEAAVTVINCYFEI